MKKTQLGSEYILSGNVEHFAKCQVQFITSLPFKNFASSL